MRYGVFEGNGIDYIILIPNGSVQTNVTFPKYKSVEIRRIENYKSDLANFYSQINSKDDLHDYFIIMNVGIIVRTKTNKVMIYKHYINNL